MIPLRPSMMDAISRAIWRSIIYLALAVLTLIATVVGLLVHAPAWGAVAGYIAFWIFLIKSRDAMNEANELIDAGDDE